MMQTRLDTSYLEMDEMNRFVEDLMNKMGTLGMSVTTESNPKKIAKLEEEMSKVQKEMDNFYKN